MRVLAVNAGSSSLKLTLLDDTDRVIANRELDASADLGEALAAIDRVDAVAHRIVHGGERFREPVRVDAEVEAALGALSELAPLHQPKSLAALEAVSRELPATPAVACFDTAFHATLPPAASTYALPLRWREELGVRRYGFHGLSHAWIARRAPELLGRPAATLRLISAHLGAGASLCAIDGGRSVDTTMGFTPLEGLVMATRSGSVDPGLVLWLMERGERLHPPSATSAQMGAALEHESGLRGLAGSADMRAVLAAAADGEARARLGLDVYIHRLSGAIAQMAASLGGVDALVFTGGVGEQSAEVRALAVAPLGFLGLVLDDGRNREPGGDRDVSSPTAGARTLVVAAREDLELARGARVVLGATQPPDAGAGS